MRPALVSTLLLSLLSLSAFPQSVAKDARTASACRPSKTEGTMLQWADQIKVRESWLQKRHQMLHEMMKRHDVDWFIVVNEEFHNDPMTQYVAPPRIYTGNRDIFVFIDTGEKLRRVAATGFSEESLRRFFESPDEPKPTDQVFKQLVAENPPKKIAVAIDGKRGVQRSLTHATYEWLKQQLGADVAAKLTSAADLIEEYADTRIPEEYPYYEQAVRLTDEITKRALSSEVIKPGKTTVGDVRNWLYDQLYCDRVGTWFQPDMRVQRKGMKNETSRGFLAIAKEGLVIQPGDALHIDFGVTYMGFDTDWQKMGYVLRRGEKDVPAGLKKAMQNTNTLQDALMIRASRPGRSAGDVYNQTMEEMKQKGITAKIYSHPIGWQGHGLGAAIDYRSAQRAKEMPVEKRLRNGSYISIELNSVTPVAEWDGQEVYVMMEDDAHLTEDGWKFFLPRQEKWYLIK
jgi:Xaa-Pro dipeptidase